MIVANSHNRLQQYATVISVSPSIGAPDGRIRQNVLSLSPFHPQTPVKDRQSIPPASRPRKSSGKSLLLAYGLLWRFRLLRRGHMILTRLKQKTLGRRDRLGKRLDLFHSVKTPDEYRLLLGKFLGFYEPVEEAL